MQLDYERWRDGVGFDLAALRDARPDERTAIEAMLLTRAPVGWREAEALAALDSEAARAALRRGLADGDAEVRLAVARYAPAVAGERGRVAALVYALEHAAPFAGLARALDEAAELHPPEVVAALLRAAREREGEVAVHCAALLLYLHGLAAEPFDMAQRPFLLRFADDDRGVRDAAFAELCRRLANGAIGKGGGNVSGEPITVLVDYRALPGREDLARRELAALAATVLAAEPACLGITVLRDDGDAARLLLLERWTDRETYLGPHMRTPHLLAFIDRAAGVFAGPPTITVCREAGAE